MHARNRLRDWENPHVLQINREPMHAPWGAYASENEAAACDRRSSSYVRTLDGTWAFHLAPSPDAVPQGFYGDAFDRSGWNAIQVPGSWELQGFDKPIYTNILYPFDLSDPNDRHLRSHDPHELEDRFLPLRPPHVPSNNPTGCYWRTFTIPEDWTGRKIFLEFGSVESAFYVWVNGEPVGYSQDSKLAAEFEVTSYLREGENTLALQVMRWSDGTYLEDQDYWHLSGIHRSVVLYAKPLHHIRDWKADALLDDGCRNGRLVVYAHVNKEGRYGDYSVRFRLLDAEGRDAIAPVVTPVATSSPMYNVTGLQPEDGAAAMEIDVPGVRLWSAERPELYTLLLTLIGPDGEEVDYESCRVGFRRVELSPEGVLLLNGKRLVIRGVNRHEHHPDTGRTITRERMREEIAAMKRLNFNAVRTSHYPNDPDWYELCDELGLYLVDEVNLETHGVQCTLSRSPEWAQAYLDRAIRLVLRDKNHPSVLIWSLGNESGAGANHAAMAGWIRYYDPYRLVQYESGDPGPLITDIRVPMYPSLSWVEEVMADSSDLRPMIMCEYAYAKSNSTGNFHKFWELIGKYPRFQGGFVWDWSDKAFRHRLADGSSAWRYGGDFGEAILDPVPDMCLNGVVSPDLEPHPGAYEIKKLQSPVTVRAKEDGTGRLEVSNGHLFTDLAGLTLHWTVTENGVAVKTGTLSLPDTPPGSRSELDIPFAAEGLKPDADYYLNVSLRLRGDTVWAEAGHELYAEQLLLRSRMAGQDAAAPQPAGKLTLTDTAGTYAVEGDGFAVTVDKRSGLLVSYSRGGRELLLSGAAENYFRAPTGIDRGQGDSHFYAAEWEAWGLDRLVRDVRGLSTALAGSAEVRIDTFAFLHPEGRSDEGFLSRMSYRIHADGTVEVCNRVDARVGLPLLPRIGVTFQVPAAMERLQWYGRGPHESYADRKSSAFVGLYEERVDGRPCPYIVPVEWGGKEDVRWFSLTDASGYGLRFEGFRPLHIDVHRNSVADIAGAGHAEELPVRDRLWVNIDHIHSGLGGDTGWTRNIHEEYQVKPGSYEYSFTLRPVGPG